MIHHFSVRKVPETFRGNTGSRAAKRGAVSDMVVLVVVGGEGLRTPTAIACVTAAQP
jgi:hypothetical protein